MGLKKFSTSESNKVRFTEDERDIFEDFKQECRDRGIDHKMLLKKINNLYRLR